jgi:uncharacterized RDD family membrane protein YckC
MQPDQLSNDLLADQEFYVRSSMGKRFGNYIIDMLIFYLLIIVIGIVIALVSPNLLEFLDDDSVGFKLLDRIVTLILYAFYMSIVEIIFEGRSIGKCITGTRAINVDGSRISASTAFARGFSRAVPFCVFSAFGTPCEPWQDRWTGTMVIDEKSYKKAAILNIAALNRGLDTQTV